MRLDYAYMLYMLWYVFQTALFSSTGIKEKSNLNKKLVEMLCILKDKINFSNILIVKISTLILLFTRTSKVFTKYKINRWCPYCFTIISHFYFWFLIKWWRRARLKEGKEPVKSAEGVEIYLKYHSMVVVHSWLHKPAGWTETKVIPFLSS